MYKTNLLKKTNIKIITSVSIAASMLLSVFSAQGLDTQADISSKINITNVSSTASRILGDVNFDNKVNLRDAIEVQKIALSMISDVGEDCELCGDVDNSGKIKLLDSLYIQKYSLQMPIEISGIGLALAPDVMYLDKSEITLGIGEGYNLTKISPTGSSLSPAVFTSDNTEVASVTSSGGSVVAKKEGTATVTVTTRRGGQASCKVTVRKAPTSVVINKSALSLAVGETYCFDTSYPIGEYAYNVSYTSSNKSVATVKASSGLMTAKSAGTAVITVTSYNGKKATCEVTVKQSKPPAPVTEDNIVNGMTRGAKSLSEVLGFNSQTYLNWLDNHDNDSKNPNYYIGTPYAGGDSRIPNAIKGAAYGHNDSAGEAGMNSTGFIWHTLYAACTFGKGDDPKTKTDGYFSGIHNGGKCQFYSPTGIKLPTLDKEDGISWYSMYSENNVKRYYFTSKQSMLNSGVLKKGDIIVLCSDRTYNGKAAENLSGSINHIGIYYPTVKDGKSVNFWHSGPDGEKDSNGWSTFSNSITQIVGMTSDYNIKIYTVIKVVP